MFFIYSRTLVGVHPVLQLFITSTEKITGIHIPDTTHAEWLHLLLRSIFKSSSLPVDGEVMMMNPRILSLSNPPSHLGKTFSTHPKVSKQWCVCVGQHGVAGTQSLHVHISGEGGGGCVGQSLS